MGRIKSSTPQGDAATTIDYHPEQYVPSLVDLTIGTSTTLEHEQWAIDGVGWVIGDSLSMPGNRSSSSLTFYDAMGRKTFVTERGSSNGTSFLSYDSFGRPASIQTADGKITTVEYQGVRIVNRTPKVWNGIGEVRATTREDYDGLGRLRSVRDPKKTLTRYVYDAAGRLKKATTSPPTGPPQVRSFNYDGRGFLTSDVQPESGTTSYKYDARGNVKMRATPTATLWSKYDEAGRLVRVYTPSQSDLKLLAYRADGKMASARAFNYRSEGAACPRYEVRQDFSYFDATHGRLSGEDTTLSKLGISSPLEQWSQSYLYDGAGRVTQVTYPYCRLATCSAAARSRTTTFEMGRPTKVTGFASAITYNDSESVHTLQHENGVTFTQNPDSSGMIRPGSIQVSGPGGVLWPEEKYIYDGSGNLAKIGPGTIGAATGKRFAYDLNSRLISAIFPVSPAIPAGLPHYQGYTYDAYGNLTVVKTGQSAIDNTAVTYGAEAATNRLPPGPAPYGAVYDGGGNLTSYQGSSYSWDSLQDLATVNTGTEAWVHTYNVAGERVWSWRTTGSRMDTFALRGQGGEVLSDFTKDSSSSPATYTWEDYAYREGQLLGAVRPGGQLVHFDVDHLGSVRLETGTNGVLINYREFWPYGDIASALPTAPQDAEQMKFTGHERDLGNPGSTADDLDYMHARYFRPLQARFLSPDPAPGIPSRPQTWNRYAYVIGNPLGIIDPTGQVLEFLSSEENKRTFEGIENSDLYGVELEIDASGDATLSANGMVGPPTEGQAQNQSFLQAVIDDPKTTSITLKSGDTETLNGNFEKGVIDVGDVKKFGNGPGATQASIGIHEIVEQYYKQVKGDPFKIAHDKGFRAENLVGGYSRQGDDPTFLPAGAGRASTTYIMSNGTRVKVSLGLSNGNIVVLKRN